MTPSDPPLPPKVKFSTFFNPSLMEMEFSKPIHPINLKNSRFFLIEPFPKLDLKFNLFRLSIHHCARVEICMYEVQVKSKSHD